MRVGYARVSTFEQNLNLQLDALRGADCEKIFTDKASGSDLHRHGLNDAMEFLRSGDTLVVWKLDRFGRSLGHTIELADLLKEKQIAFVSITEAIDTSTATGKFFFHVIAAMAQFEKDRLIERTTAGLAAARARGRLGGRPSLSPKKIKQGIALANAGSTAGDVAIALNISVATFYRHIYPKAMSEHPTPPSLRIDA